MKIIKRQDELLEFDNGFTIRSDHSPDCCEWNYADFSNMDTEALEYDFPTNLKFEATENYGFRFGDGKRMFFVPCYSDQNGYYSDDLDIYYKRGKREKHVLNCLGVVTELPPNNQMFNI